ncbi:MAG: hypothetical protein E6K55_04435, partial [Gemmatimonadetes bacterium]
MASTTGAAAVCSDADGCTGAGFAPARKSHWGTLGIIAILLGVSCKSVEDIPRSQILASEPVTGGGGAHAISTGLIFSLDISSVAPTCREQGVAIFYRTIIRDGDDHHTLVADAGNEPDFAAFTHLLTDGVDEEATWCVFLENVGGGGEGRPESQFFAGRPGTAPDFASYTIDRVEFQIDSVLIASPGSDQNHDGI